MSTQAGAFKRIIFIELLLNVFNSGWNNNINYE